MGTVTVSDSYKNHSPRGEKREKRIIKHKSNLQSPKEKELQRSAIFSNRESELGFTEINQRSEPQWKTVSTFPHCPRESTTT